jgi:hypothetical protein
LAELCALLLADEESESSRHSTPQARGARAFSPLQEESGFSVLLSLFSWPIKIRCASIPERKVTI